MAIDRCGLCGSRVCYERDATIGHYEVACTSGHLIGYVFINDDGKREVTLVGRTPPPCHTGSLHG